MVIGVTVGYSKELNLVGVGYTAEIKGTFILINAGYSHSIYFEIPNDIDVEVPNSTTIIIKGINKQNVGDVAAKIRQIRKPEPYKGKGIKYSNEIIRRKAGKTVGAGAA
jgi:large subunit ribosomal protein L6